MVTTIGPSPTSLAPKGPLRVDGLHQEVLHLGQLVGAGQFVECPAQVVGRRHFQHPDRAGLRVHFHLRHLGTKGIGQRSGWTRRVEGPAGRVLRLATHPHPAAGKLKVRRGHAEQGADDPGQLPAGVLRRQFDRVTRREGAALGKGAPVEGGDVRVTADDANVLGLYTEDFGGDHRHHRVGALALVRDPGIGRHDAVIGDLQQRRGGVVGGILAARGLAPMPIPMPRYGGNLLYLAFQPERSTTRSMHSFNPQDAKSLPSRA